MPTEAMVLKTFDDVKVADLKPYEEKATIKNLVKPFKSEGKIAKTDTDAKLGTTTWTLSNGAKLPLRRRTSKMTKLYLQPEAWRTLLFRIQTITKPSLLFLHCRRPE
jgi:hypothetical protein